MEDGTGAGDLEGLGVSIFSFLSAVLHNVRFKKFMFVLLGSDRASLAAAVLLV